MKVLHIRDQYLRVSFIYFLLIGFRKYRHQVLCREIIQKDLTLYPYKDISKTSNIFMLTWLLDKIFTVKLKFNARIINDWIAYYNLVKNDKDIIAIHAHMGQQGVYAMPLSKKLKKPLVVTFYGADMSDQVKVPGWKRKYKMLFKDASMIIVEGAFMKEKMVELGCDFNKVEVVKIGVPFDHLQFNYRPQFEERTTLKVLMCATFVPKKGYLKALSVVKMLKEEGIMLEVSIIGDGPLKEDIYSFISENDLNKEVFLLGRKTLPEIYEMSKEMHVFYHPSETGPNGDSEGGAPTIIIEMQALGLPIIATKHADIPNVIPIENHFLAEEFDKNDLKAQFLKLMNISNWDRISEKGREYVLFEHSNMKCSGKMESLYEKFIE